MASKNLVDLMKRVADFCATRPDLIREPWRTRVLNGAHPLTGHCYVASEALWHLAGGKESGLTPVSAKVEGATHWWLRAKDGTVYDATDVQFDNPVPRHLGRGRGFMTRKPSKRAQVVVDALT